MVLIWFLAFLVSLVRLVLHTLTLVQTSKEVEQIKLLRQIKLAVFVTDSYYGSVDFDGLVIISVALIMQTLILELVILQ